MELAREGANLVINDRPDSPDLEATAEDIRALGVECQAIEEDVFARDGCERLVAAIGALDILVRPRLSPVASWS